MKDGFKKPKEYISALKAAELLAEGKILRNYIIEEEIILEKSDGWNCDLTFENCHIAYFSGSCTQFNKSVKFINCHIKKCQFTFTYFIGGLTIDNCIFENHLDFQAGGHNKKGPIIITNTNFMEFVNFFDCIYENDIIIERNYFHKGTNLLAKIHNISVTFKTLPIVEGNTGQLDVENEG